MFVVNTTLWKAPQRWRCVGRYKGRARARDAIRKGKSCGLITCGASRHVGHRVWDILQHENHARVWSRLDTLVRRAPLRTKRSQPPRQLELGPPGEGQRSAAVSARSRKASRRFDGKHPRRQKRCVEDAADEAWSRRSATQPHDNHYDSISPNLICWNRVFLSSSDRSKYLCDARARGVILGVQYIVQQALDYSSTRVGCRVGSFPLRYKVSALHGRAFRGFSAHVCLPHSSLAVDAGRSVSNEDRAEGPAPARGCSRAEIDSHPSPICVGHRRPE